MTKRAPGEGRVEKLAALSLRMLALTLKCPSRVLCSKSATAPSSFLMKTPIVLASTARREPLWKRAMKTPRDVKDNAVILPEFQVLLRQLYRKSHPDLLRASHPEAAEVNDSSMQLLNGVLSTIKKFNQFPAQIVKTIPFNVKNGDQVTVVNLKIQTAGGDCRRALTGSFRDFFYDAGIIESKIGAQFSWGKDYFPKIPGENDDEEKNGQ